jgi:PhnB protein
VTRTEIIPYIFYRDIPSALAWLTRAFGFKEEMRTGTPSGGMHAEMSIDGRRIMMGQGAKDWGMVSPRDATMATTGDFHLSR